MASYFWGQPLKSVPTILDNWYFSLFKYILKKFKTNIFFTDLFLLMCVSICLLLMKHVCVPATVVPVLGEAEKGDGSTGDGITDDYGPPLVGVGNQI